MDLASQLTVGRSLAGVSFLLHTASLTQNAFYTERAPAPDAWPAFSLLLIGWMGVLIGVFAWLANPALWAAWILMCFRRTTLIGLGFAVVALALALSFLGEREMMRDESGYMSKIVGYGPGYWLWLASITTAIVGCIIGMRESRPRQVMPPPLPPQE